MSMNPFWTGLGTVCCLIVSAVSGLKAQRIPIEKRVFNEQVLRSYGQPVIPIYDGWYQNADGTYDICFGYFNLNMDEPLDIPVGERNRLIPAEYDGGQPTHFAPVPGMSDVSQMTSRFRRYWCVYTVTVPEDFAMDNEIQWSLQRMREDVGGSVVSVPGTLNPAYVMDEIESDARGDVAPTLRFAEGGASFQGRHGFTGPSKTARVGRALDLNVWAEHPFEEQVWLGWVQFSGPGKVTFDPGEQEVSLTEGSGMATTRATFSEPGSYTLLVQSINTTAAFEFLCCWTNGYIQVTVTD